MLPPIALRPTAFLKLLKSFRPIRKTIFSRKQRCAERRHRCSPYSFRMFVTVVAQVSILSGTTKIKNQKDRDFFFFFFKDSVYFFESLRTNKRTRNRILKEVNFFFHLDSFVLNRRASIERRIRSPKGVNFGHD